MFVCTLVLVEWKGGGGPTGVSPSVWKSKGSTCANRPTCSKPKRRCADISKNEDWTAAEIATMSKMWTQKVFRLLCRHMLHLPSACAVHAP
eukprot:1156712-Pelagomonas_calceolata.AAC.7